MEQNQVQNIPQELFVRVDNNTINSEKITAPRYSYWKSVGRSFFRNPVNYIVLGLVIFILIMSFIYPLFSPYSQAFWIKENYGLPKEDIAYLTPGKAIDYHGFNLRWVFGTGQFGEPLFDALWAGAQSSLALAFVCAAINITVGIIVGALWGYSKIVDKIMQEVYNIVSNIPYLMFITVFVAVVGTGFWSFVAAMTVTGWLGVAYFIRTQVIIIRDREYNLASRCLGTPILRMVTKNILPFLTSVIVTITASEIPSYISTEVFLSYLQIGLGSENSLGKLINDNQQYMDSHPHLFWIPVIVSSVITVSLYIIGQNLADASDPKTHM